MGNRISMFGVSIDCLTMVQAVDRLLEWTRETDRRCHYVVTPNVDHVVKLQENEAFLDAYRDADMVLVDGKPVLLASRIFGKPLPETVPGSDLAPALFSASQRQGGLSVFLLGAADGVAERAAKSIVERWPWVRIVGVYSPPMGFSANSPDSEVAINLVNEAAPDILVIGLGAPKQEIWVHTVRERLATKCALCIGATIDFLAGEKRRAPKWMQKIGMEWLHRMLSEPGRLARRYLHDARIFPRLVFRELLYRK